ncbi:MAG TPA: hypothetical protein VE863_15255 [Pyrinomonadaceae bacterium]|jgi:hypothetical protein|nr:hypothetical protein [Pyrinomonadaceae bacterium]
MEDPEKVESKGAEAPSPKNAFQRFKTTKTWTAIEILSPILAIVIPLALYFYSIKSGQLTITGIQRTSLIDTRNAIGQDVTVLYRKAPIASLVSYTLEIANTGNTDIGKEDVYKLRWVPPTNAQIIDARIISTSGAYGDFISLDLADPHSIGINVLALNKGVAARISILCSSESAAVDDSTAKIDGVLRGASIVDNSQNFNASHQNSFFANVFAGGFWTNIVKAIIFFLLTLFVVVLTLIPFAKLQSVRYQKRMEQQGKEFEEKKLLKQREQLQEQRLLVLSIGSDTLAKDDLADPSSVKWLAESIDFFKALNQEQFDLCRWVVEKTPDGNLAKLVVDNGLTPKQRETMLQAPNIDSFFNNILRYRSIYKPDQVVDALVYSGRFADHQLA